MNRFSKVWVLLFLCIFFFQCQKDLSYIGAPDSGVPAVITPVPITAILQGNIVDENSQPAAGVTVAAGTKTATTNGSGYFRITDASLDKNTSLVTAEKAGYFKGYRVFAATSGTNQVVIKLIKKNLAGTITASSGGDATLLNGSKISLPANSVVKTSSGSAYSGDVNVYAAYIDPGASDIAETVPGSFVANDKNGKRVILSSYGMLAVELESSGGEKLQIKSGAVATLTSPIPSEVLSSAPATISLWYVDEQTGVWKEEGSATKQGNDYVGDVKHFSYWNCDYPYDAVSLSVTLHNDKGLPLVNAPVNIRPEDFSGLAHGYTDSLGQIKGLVPSNKKLLLEVIDPCGNTAYSMDVSPLNKTTDLGIIIITNSTSSLSTLTGTLLDCSSSPVKKGYVFFNFNNIIYYAATDAAGRYAITFVTCSDSSSTALVLGVDETAQQQGEATVTITAPVTNIGNIAACSTSSEQFINYTLDGTSYSIASAANDILNGGTNEQGTSRFTTIGGMKNPPAIDNLSFSVTDDSTSTGTFPITGLKLQNYISVILTQPFNVTFTRYANSLGGFYEGTFSGKFTADSTTTVHNISSTFKVRRNN